MILTKVARVLRLTDTHNRRREGRKKAGRREEGRKKNGWRKEGVGRRKKPK